MRLTLGNTMLNTDTQTVTVKSRVMTLNRQEFNLLRKFCETPSQPVLVEDLIQAVNSANPKSFTVVLGRVRKFLQEVGSDWSIETQRVYANNMAPARSYTLFVSDTKVVTETYTEKQHKAVIECIKRVAEQDPQLASLAYGGPIL